MGEEDTEEEFAPLSTEREVLKNLVLLTLLNSLALFLAWVLIKLEPLLKSLGVIP